MYVILEMHILFRCKIRNIKLKEFFKIKLPREKKLIIKMLRIIKYIVNTILLYTLYRYLYFKYEVIFYYFI